MKVIFDSDGWWIELDGQRIAGPFKTVRECEDALDMIENTKENNPCSTKS